MGSRQRIHFGSTGWAIDFEGCEEIVASLPHVFSGWKVTTGAPDEVPGGKLRAIISRQQSGWHWKAVNGSIPRDWNSHPPTSPIRVICDIHDVVFDWYLQSHRDLLCMHGAAVKLGRGLTCFPAKGFTGKSLLIAHLAMRGLKVFADDVLALEHEENRGRAFGFMPRLRAQLPSSLSRKMHAFIATHQGPADSRWIYLKLDHDRLAPLGQTSRINRFILLDRQETGRPQLVEARASEVLQSYIRENTVRVLPPREIFDRLFLAVDQAERYWLRYSHPQQAADFLARNFG